MVELQETISNLDRAAITVYALSYDPVETLHKFAGENSITFALLSDIGSVTIERLGLLNPHVRRQHQETNEVHETRFEGVPYPVTFLLDGEGRIVDRRIHPDYRIRETASALLDGRSGFRGVEIPGPSHVGNVVTINVHPQTDRFSPYQMIWFEVNIAIQPGWRIYGYPAPQGLRPLSVEIESRKFLQPRETLIEREPQLRNVAGTDQTVPTFAGALKVRLPVVLATWRHRPVCVNGVVEYQACSRTECLPPARFGWSICLHPREG